MVSFRLGCDVTALKPKGTYFDGAEDLFERGKGKGKGKGKHDMARDMFITNASRLGITCSEPLFNALLLYQGGVTRGSVMCEFVKNVVGAVDVRGVSDVWIAQRKETPGLIYADLGCVGPLCVMMTPWSVQLARDSLGPGSGLVDVFEFFLFEKGETLAPLCAQTQSVFITSTVLVEQDLAKIRGALRTAGVRYFGCGPYGGMAVEWNNIRGTALAVSLAAYRIRRWIVAAIHTYVYRAIFHPMKQFEPNERVAADGPIKLGGELLEISLTRAETVKHGRIEWTLYHGETTIKFRGSRRRVYDLLTPNDQLLKDNGLSAYVAVDNVGLRQLNLDLIERIGL